MRNRMNLTTKRTARLCGLLCLLLLALTLSSHRAAAAGTQPTVTEVSSGKYTITGGTDTEANGKALQALIAQGNVEVTVTGTYDYHVFFPGNNVTINGDGATFRAGLRINASDKAYDSGHDLVINGGSWTGSYSWVNGQKTSRMQSTTMQFAHARDITISNATIRAPYEGHAIELIACSDVTISGCNVSGIGTNPAGNHEEQIQIDLADPKTAPTIGAAYQNGKACRNITITGCTVRGGRAVCANFTQGSNLNSFHKNITVSNCRLTGLTGEALALFNCLGVKVTGNTIISKLKDKTSPYSIGCHVASFGKTRALRKSTVTITGNKVKGGRQSIFVCNHDDASSLTYAYKLVTITGNKCWCRAGVDQCVRISANGAVKRKVSGNKTKLWK